MISDDDDDDDDKEESQTSFSFSSSSNCRSYTTNKVSKIKKEFNINNKDNPIYVSSDSEDEDLQRIQPDFPSPHPSVKPSSIMISPMHSNSFSFVFNHGI